MGTSRDNDLATVAASQHGVVSRAQLTALGLSPKAIVGRVRGGRLHRVHRGVYAVGHRALDREGRLLAAVMACGPDAVLSHASAGVVWGLRPSSAARIDVTVASTAGRAGPVVVRLHRCPSLRHRDRDRVGALPVTTVARTLLDLAAVLPRRPLERALDQAEALRLFDLRALHEVVAANPRRPGTRALAAVLDEHQVGTTLTRSDLEERFLAFLDAHDLPRPLVNHVVAGHEVDAFWPFVPLAVELDSRRHHDTSRAFETDRIRDADLALAGVTVVRVTHRRLTRAPAEVAETLRALLRGPLSPVGPPSPRRDGRPASGRSSAARPSGAPAARRRSRGR